MSSTTTSPSQTPSSGNEVARVPSVGARTLLGLWLVLSSVACLAALFLVFSQPALLRSQELAPGTESTQVPEETKQPPAEAKQQAEPAAGEPPAGDAEGAAGAREAPPASAGEADRRKAAADAKKATAPACFGSFECELSLDQALLLLALLAGALGGSLHALQSFAAFVGNRRLRRSWFWWYLVRVPIGAILGMFFYVVLRAGLFSGSSSGASPYGVVAIGALAGLFSERATRKLQEVFDVLFPTQEQYADRLARGAILLASVAPAPLSMGGPAVALTVMGSGFSKQCVLRIADMPLETTFISESELEATFDPAALDPAKRPAPGAKARLTVFDPGPPERQSNALDVDVT